MYVRFSAVEMLTFAHPRAIRSANCASVIPLPPCKRDRDRVGLDDVGDALGIEGRSAAYMPCALPIAGAKQSIPVSRMNVERHVERLPGGLLIRTDAVLDSLDALDLALDVRPVPAGLGHDLLGLPLVLLDGEGRGVEQHGVPPTLQARADHLALGTVIEVERDGNLDTRGHGRHIA